MLTGFLRQSILEVIEHFCYTGRKNFAELQPGMETPQNTILTLRPLQLSAFTNELKKLGC